MIFAQVNDFNYNNSTKIVNHGTDMEAVQKTKKIDADSRAQEYSDNDLAADRIENFSDSIASAIRAGQTQVDRQSFAQTDAIFMMQTLLSYIKSKAINEITPEKQKLIRRLKSKTMFINTLAKHGGVLSSAETAELLGVSKVTIKKKKDTDKLLALNIDGEFYYPIFQFTEETTISEKGVLKGVAELLPLLSQYSDRMKYSFFMEARSTVLTGVDPKRGSFAVADLLKEVPSDIVMQELARLARLYGSQDPA